MKRLLSLTAAVLALAMMLALAGCNGGDGEKKDPVQTKTVDLVALRDQMLADNNITDSVNVDVEGLQSAYQIDPETVANVGAFNATSGAAFPQEVVMVQAVDETAAADIAKKLEGRLSNIAEQAASYDPDSQALAEKCKVVTDGVYVGMFFSEHYDTMVSAFQTALA